VLGNPIKEGWNPVSNSITERVRQLVEEAEQNRLYGEILLRFRAGHLVFVTETKTTPVEEGTAREYPTTR
jgi:hypothetical protein